MIRYGVDDGDYLVISHMLHVFISILTCHYKPEAAQGTVTSPCQPNSDVSCYHVCISYFFID